jgi:hypothetical protein
MPMNEPTEPPAAYIPPPPSLPVMSAAVSVPILVVKEEVPKVEAKREEPTEEISPEAALNEWIISVLKDAISYPTRKHGWAILVPGAVLTIAMPIVALLPILGPIICLGIFGFLAAYYLDIIGTSTNGDRALPDWPVVTNMAEDIFWPALKVIGVCFISFAPSILYSLIQGKVANDGVIGSLFYLISAAYIPMACIALVMTDSLTSALPHRVIPAIKRCLPEYLVPVLVLISIKVLTVLVEGLSVLILPVLLSAILTSLITFYGLILQARITGLTCHRFRERIQWG